MLLTTRKTAASNSGDTFIRADKTETNFSTILNSFKGQVVYLDIWASWCAPCRSEIPAAAKLCLLYTSDAADERSSVDLGGSRIIKKKNIVE